MFSDYLFEKLFMFGFYKLSLSVCIPWMIVGLVESISIVTINLCTIIVFIKSPDLRMRSTRLLINLAVIDIYVGWNICFVWSVLFGWNIL